MTRKEIKEMKKRWREALATPTKPLHDPVPFGDIIDSYLECQESCEDCISRTQAIKAMDELENEDIEAYGCSIPEGFDGERARQAICLLPSIQPKPKTDVLDKIRAEIESHIIESNGLDFNSALYIAIEIINNYRAESEDNYITERRTE